MRRTHVLVALAAGLAVACAVPSQTSVPRGVPLPQNPAAILPPELRAPEAPAEPAPTTTQAILVNASAYNSVRSQADSTPTITAFGEKLRPGMRTIAVSRDLEALGLEHGTLVRIDELPGVWRVADRMSSRWTKTIDLYFGNDIRAAREWGRRSVTIRFDPEAPVEKVSAAD